MKVSFAFTFVFAMMAVSFAFAQVHEKTETAATPWFDMENCEICKCLSAHKGLMESVKWETHLLDNGSISIAVVPDDMKPTYVKAMKDMDKEIARVDAGENVKCCGYCMGMGELISAGAHEQKVSTAGGELVILTSSDPDLVAKIQQHAKRTIAEQAKLMKQMGEQQSEKTETANKKSSDGK